jgi:hypothetical protein
MKYYLVLILLSFYTYAAAQDCDQAMLAKKTGTWKAGLKGSTTNVSAADLLKEKATLASVHQMIGANYQPMGCQLLYSNSFSGYNAAAAKNWIADTYQYTMYILRFLCDQQSADKSKYYVDISTSTTVTITANTIWQLNNLFAADLPDDDFRGYLKMKDKPQWKDGFYYMGEEVVGDGDRENKMKEYRWLITYGEQLPFSYVSRKEYLLIQKKRLQKTIKDDQSSKSFYDQYMNRILDNLKKDEGELNAPAICMWNDEEKFTGFVNEGTKGSFFAVKPNSNYYDKKLSRSAPQFFSVVYRISHGDPVFEYNIASIQKAVNFSTLRNMLGKEPAKTIIENAVPVKPKPVAKEAGTKKQQQL